LTDGDTAVGVELDNGEQLLGKRILSSAGHVETLRMCQNASVAEPPQAGQMSFIESISVIPNQPSQIGYEDTILFYNDSPQFHWERPASDLCDVRTGVVCSPNNYLYDGDASLLPEGIIRITSIASYDRWQALDEAQYRREKLRWYDRSVASAVRFMPDFRPHVIDTDMFTPTTIRRFTWHDNGAVYGAPDKKLDGTTHLQNLYLCGTDQGFVGIIGAMMSGISMANMHCLKS
jgi:phytoene dehydrogenase-like protein